MTYAHVQANWSNSIFPIFRKWLSRHCDTPQAFILEDFRRWCAPQIKAGQLDEPPHPNAWGGLIQRAKLAGVITKTGDRQQSVHREAHGREVKVWRKAA